MLRTLAISLILVLSVGVMLPFANSAHGVRQTTQIGIRRHHRYHSRAWWRRYRARLKKKRAAAALAHRMATLGQPQNIPLTAASLNSLPVRETVPATIVAEPTATVTVPTTVTAAANLPAPATINGAASVTGPAAVNLPTVMGDASFSAPPAKWTRKAKVTALKASDVRTPVKSTGLDRLPGQMNLSVVALSRPNPVFLTSREQSKMLGGTSISELRRIVIDKMVVTGGWVTNDYVREYNGSRVFVVTARTPRDANSPEKDWTFYFTEADGRIYGLSTEAPRESAERMTMEAERFINKLHMTSEPNNR